MKAASKGEGSASGLKSYGLSRSDVAKLVTAEGVLLLTTLLLFDNWEFLSEPMLVAKLLVNPEELVVVGGRSPLAAAAGTAVPSSWEWFEKDNDELWWLLVFSVLLRGLEQFWGLSRGISLEPAVGGIILPMEDGERKELSRQCDSIWEAEEFPPMETGRIPFWSWLSCFLHFARRFWNQTWNW